jgi:hypothetical protein
VAHVTRGEGRPPDSASRYPLVCDDGLVEWNLDIGAEQFERLCQDLARHVIGPAVRVVRTGPDSGWDTEFEGPVHYPASAPDEQWDGFGVLIVKYKSSSADRTAASTWYRHAVRRTLEMLTLRADKTSSARFPEYIVLATNVSLPPSAMDSIGELVARYAAKLSIKGWSIWDHDVISRYIDSLPDVRYSYILGHDYIPADREPVEIGRLSRFELSPLGVRPSCCPEIVPAWWRLVSTRDSVAGLFDILYSVRHTATYGEHWTGYSGFSDGFQDLLRAAIVFTSAGVDACLEVLLVHAVPVLIDCNGNARGKFERYIDNQANAPKVTQDFLGAIKDLNPRMRLLELYVRDLTSASFQGSKSIKDRCLAALGITNEQLPYSRLTTLESFFRARNDVAHRLDLMQPTKDDAKPDRQPRRQDDVGQMCDEVLILVCDLIKTVAENLDECR